MGISAFWLALAASVLAEPASGKDRYVEICEEGKSNLAEMKYRCPEEVAEGSKVACRGLEDARAVGRWLKQCSDRLQAAIAGKPGSDPAAIHWTCRAADPADGKGIGEASGKGVLECSAALKEKVKAERCTGVTASVAYLHQSWAGGKWTRGVKKTLPCE